MRDVRFVTRIRPGGEVKSVRMGSVQREFVFPATIAHGEAMREALIEEVERMQEDLKNPPVSTNGDGHVFYEWRQRATTAVRYKQAELRVLNSWLREQRRAANDRAIGGQLEELVGGVDMKDPRALLKAAYKVLTRMAKEGIDLDSAEQAVVDAIRVHLTEVARHDSIPRK